MREVISLRMTDQELKLAILRQVAEFVDAAIVPVSDDRLKRLSPDGAVLGHLMEMKTQGMIRGDVITAGADSVPHRMTNIRLTYQGLRVLNQGPKER